MNFIIIVLLVILFLKYKDMSKELLDINNRLESLDLNIEQIDSVLGRVEENET